MTIFRSYNYQKQGKISAQAVDTTSGEYIWIAFDDYDETGCTLKKVSAYDPSLSFFTVTIPVEKINKIVSLGNYIFLAVEDSNYYMYKVYKFNPLTSVTGYSHPSGINENPIDIAIYNNELYFLFPGEVSGENAKIVVTSSSGTFSETIDLIQSGAEVYLAKRLAITDTGDIYVVTYTSPIQVVRIYDNGGWELSIKEIV